MVTKDVSLVSVLALLASVELETQRAERKREGAREIVWRESIHGPLPCTYSVIRNMTRAEREGLKPDILYQHGREQGPLSLDSLEVFTNRSTFAMKMICGELDRVF